MTSQEALRILTWFNEEAFGVPRDRLADNFDPQWYRDNGLSLPDGAKQAIELINVNLIAFKGLSKVNQHLPFHFNMILNPEQFAPEWKQLLHQMLDFLEFKEVMLPKHQNEISKLAQKKRDVIETEKQLMLEHQKLDQLADQKQQNQEIVAEQQLQIEAKQQMIVQIEPELQQLRQDLQGEKDKLEAQRQVKLELEDQKADLERRIKEMRALKVT